MSKEFPELHELPKVKLKDGTVIKRLKAGKFKKTKLGQRFNGKHND